MPGRVELLDAWDQRLLLSRSNGSSDSIYLWEPGMSDARYLFSTDSLTLQVNFGRTKDEILRQGITYVGSGLTASQYDDLMAYDSMGRQTGLLWRMPQDPYGTNSYMETTSFTVDRATGRIYLTGFWNYYPHTSSGYRAYMVMIVRSDAAPVETNVSSNDMLASGHWVERLGVVHWVPGTHKFISDVQTVRGSVGYFIQDPSYNGGSVCTFRVGAPTRDPASCFRMNTGEYIWSFVMQNPQVGYAIEFIQSSRDFIVRQLDLSRGVDEGMIGRASHVAIGGK